MIMHVAGDDGDAGWANVRLKKKAPDNSCLSGDPRQQPANKYSKQLVMPVNRLLGLDAICKYECRHRHAMLRLIKQGYPAVKIGGRWEAHIDVIEDWWRHFFVQHAHQGSKYEPTEPI